jgi:hypothetical protein
MDYKKIPLNAIPSKEDKRDYLISRLIASVNVFPEEYFNVYNHDILNQGNVGSCVAHSIDGYCRSITEEKQSNKYQLFSSGFRYGMRNITDYQGEGMEPREALESAKDFGSVPYVNFPYNESYWLVKNRIDQYKDELLKIADPYKITAYCRLYTESDVKNALMQLGLITVCIPIYESFYNTGSDGMVPTPNIIDENLCGSHEVSQYGWRKDRRDAYLNSWGNEWGDNGRFYLASDYPIIEKWSISDTILPHPEPEPIKQTYWRVQVGAFSDINNANKLVVELKGKGLSTYITLVNNLYKIQLGAFIEKSNAENFKQKIIGMGYKAFLINY